MLAQAVYSERDSRLRRSTINSSLDCVLNSSLKDGTLSPHFHNAPNLELNFLCRALVGSGSGIGDNLEGAVRDGAERRYDMRKGRYRTKGKKEIFLLSCFGLLDDLWTILAPVVHSYSFRERQHYHSRDRRGSTFYWCWTL